MAYDLGLAQRVREALAAHDEVTEKKMFGGVAFMVRGHMCCGITREDLMVRLGPDAYQQALGEVGARPMDFTGKALKGFVYVGPDGYEDDDALAGWVQRAAAFVRTLPPK